MVKRVLDVGLGVSGIPAVDVGDVRAGSLGVAADAGEAEVLYLVAGGAEGDDAFQALDTCRCRSELVAFNGVPWPTAAADLTAVAGVAGGAAA